MTKEEKKKMTIASRHRHEVLANFVIGTKILADWSKGQNLYSGDSTLWLNYTG